MLNSGLCRCVIAVRLPYGCMVQLTDSTGTPRSSCTTNLQPTPEDVPMLVWCPSCCLDERGKRVYWSGREIHQVMPRSLSGTKITLELHGFEASTRAEYMLLKKGICAPSSASSMGSIFLDKACQQAEYRIRGRCQQELKNRYTPEAMYAQTATLRNIQLFMLLTV